MGNASNVLKVQAFTGPVPVAARKPPEPRSPVLTAPVWPTPTPSSIQEGVLSVRGVSKSIVMGFAPSASLGSTRLIICVTHAMAVARPVLTLLTV